MLNKNIDFNLQDFKKGKINMVCRNKELANDFCNFLYLNNIKWLNGEETLNNSLIEKIESDKNDYDDVFIYYTCCHGLLCFGRYSSYVASKYNNKKYFFWEDYTNNLRLKKEEVIKDANL